MLLQRTFPDAEATIARQRTSDCKAVGSSGQWSHCHRIVVAVAVVVVVIIDIIVLFVDSGSHVVSVVVCAEIRVCADSVWRAIQERRSSLPSSFSPPPAWSAS